MWGVFPEFNFSFYKVWIIPLRPLNQLLRWSVFYIYLCFPSAFSLIFFFLLLHNFCPTFDHKGWQHHLQIIQSFQAGQAGHFNNFYRLTLKEPKHALAGTGTGITRLWHQYTNHYATELDIRSGPDLNWCLRHSKFMPSWLSHYTNGP